LEINWRSQKFLPIILLPSVMRISLLIKDENWRIIFNLLSSACEPAASPLASCKIFGWFVLQQSAETDASALLRKNKTPYSTDNLSNISTACHITLHCPKRCYTYGIIRISDASNEHFLLGIYLMVQALGNKSLLLRSIYSPHALSRPKHLQWSEPTVYITWVR
jgi:hypothetical protein